MSTSLPCLMTRKKKIPGTRRFNAEKVLADFTPNLSTNLSLYSSTFHAKSNCTAPVAGKTNQSDANSVCFLYENPHFINEPVCFANTKQTTLNQAKWWPETITTDEKPKPQYKKDTISRSDYKTITNPPIGLTRFGCNAGRLKVAHGIVPSHSDEPLFAKEKISYQHQFDSRQDRKERGKLHGSFVWEPILDKNIQERIKLRMRQHSSHVF